MSVLVDTNVLIRVVQRDAPVHDVAVRALRVLRTRGDGICIVPQNLYEFWAVVTRPPDVNGFGLTPAEAASAISRLEQLCTILRDPPELFDVWRRLVAESGVSGKKTHDARLVAAMRVHGIGRILTLNGGDFVRYPEVTVIDPVTI